MLGLIDHTQFLNNNLWSYGDSRNVFGSQNVNTLYFPVVLGKNVQYLYMIEMVPLCVMKTTSWILISRLE